MVLKLEISAKTKSGIVLALYHLHKELLLQKGVGLPESMHTKNYDMVINISDEQKELIYG